MRDNFGDPPSAGLAGTLRIIAIALNRVPLDLAFTGRLRNHGTQIIGAAVTGIHAFAENEAGSSPAVSLANDRL